MHNKKTHMIAFVLLMIGGFNWLFVGLFNAELGGWLLGGMDSLASKTLYILVGLAAVYELVSHKGHCKHCRADGTCGTCSVHGAEAAPASTEKTEE